MSMRASDQASVPKPCPVKPPNLTCSQRQQQQQQQQQADEQNTQHRWKISSTVGQRAQHLSSEATKLGLQHNTAAAAATISR
jgi:hypothetical protein